MKENLCFSVFFTRVVPEIRASSPDFYMDKTLLFLLFSICFAWSSIQARDVVPSTDPILTAHQRDVISYFKEIALGFEYGNASGITRKWKTPMTIFLQGSPSPSSEMELDRVIAELNSLFSDGFRISRTDHQDSSNFVIFFGSRTDFVSRYPADSETVKSSSGIFRIFWNKTNFISRGYVFIHTATSEQEQRHAIREELTQALGLGKDSPAYPESIFQSKWTIPTEYYEIDREIIRCLYHPLMKVGLTDEAVEHVLIEIFQSERSNL
jgi:hypothetical protein